jgi:halocyanin-like protein
MERRTLLAVLGGSVAIAGCTGDDSGGNDTDDNGTNGPEGNDSGGNDTDDNGTNGPEDNDSGGNDTGGNGTDEDPDTDENIIEIDEIELRNLDTQSHRLALAVTRDGTTVHDQSYDLERGGTATVDSLPEEAGAYTVRVEPQNSEAAVLEQMPGQLTSVGCILMDVEILPGDPPFITQTAEPCTAQRSPTAQADRYLRGSNASGYDGEIVDRTDSDSVTVRVGSGPSGLAFDPAALRVESGTTVTWEWTGDGGRHNVVTAEVPEGGQQLDSGRAVAEGTYSETLDTTGAYRYYCSPHRIQGMHGAIVVE